MLQATLEVVAKDGLQNLTFSGIGRRAGVHGTSVQRRWGSRENLFFEAIRAFAHQTIQVPDTGALRTDLVAISRSLSDYFATPVGQSILCALVTNAESDGAFSASRAAFIQARHDAMRVMIQRARERRELGADIDDETALSLLLGSIYVRTTIVRRAMDDSHIEQVVDAIIAGVCHRNALSASNPPQAARPSAEDIG